MKTWHIVLICVMLVFAASNPVKLISCATINWPLQEQRIYRVNDGVNPGSFYTYVKNKELAACYLFSR